jgi:cytochrome oxidase assembly protein ShyY1
VLATRRWLGALALAAAFAVAAYFLGHWQWDRHEQRRDRADRISSHYDAQPVPLAGLLGTAAMPRTEEWTRVTATGRYAAAEPLLVRNRPLDGTYGYEVLVPLQLDDGTSLLVDRGWVPNAEEAAARPEVPATPAGDVTVTGWLRPSEPSLDRDLPEGQLASINLAEAREQTGARLLGAYLVLGLERTTDGTEPGRPAPLERPDTDLGPHQAYAFQWWGSMPLGFLLVYFGIRREVRGGAPAARQDKPRKVRIWDEEDG